MKAKIRRAALVAAILGLFVTTAAFAGSEGDRIDADELCPDCKPEAGQKLDEDEVRCVIGGGSCASGEECCSPTVCIDPGNGLVCAFPVN